MPTSSGQSEQAVFRALADPTRRALLDALYGSDGQSVSQLAARFPDMSRFGVMKHLAVLTEADLVVSSRRGRTKLHFLNPVPIAEIADRWISKYAQPFSTGLLELRDSVERAHPAPSAQERA
ncbi:metalloregulator ArsR/SmtB family transcription factor [Microlunatus panaciterrae]|uniref:DNA-binding transcriptional ArsR family regulator n=1 Tax=Microlunatus panaciterrae TaxID=400768 RepID=A0ABS2RMS7_9ACTN|nr:DNA-binding transcriptional ArsR family regulator [Microlunatus panaciterrae]